MKEPIIILFLVLATSTVAATQERPCSREEAMAAEVEAAALKTWNAVHNAYKKYKHCDDGAFAEGYSWSIMKLLTVHWETISELQPYWKESGFSAFVIRHIDETYSKEEAKTVTENTMKKCPRHMSHICEELRNAAQSATSEWH
jgi:hypothetical protein